MGRRGRGGWRRRYGGRGGQWHCSNGVGTPEAAEAVSSSFERSMKKEKAKIVEARGDRIRMRMELRLVLRAVVGFGSDATKKTESIRANTTIGVRSKGSESMTLLRIQLPVLVDLVSFSFGESLVLEHVQSLKRLSSGRMTESVIKDSMGRCTRA